MNLAQMAHVWWRLRRGEPVGLSIDITDRCTLSCAGCYMRWYRRNADLPLERWDEIIRSFPRAQRYFCAWTGGEPLMRAGDIRALSGHFAWNWVATNGTLEIPELPRTTVFVSVDGPEPTHNSVRARWKDVERNVRPDCYIACTIRRENSAPDLLREHVAFWRPRSRGIVFSFLTPRKGNEDERASLTREERRGVLRTLQDLRREHGGFVVGVSGQIPDSAETAWGGRCPAEAALVTFDAAGQRKRPCTLGPKVDCSRCGCAVPGFLRRVSRLHMPTLCEVARLFCGGPTEGPRTYTGRRFRHP